jgi:flagellar hook-length control protein FliK
MATLSVSLLKLVGQADAPSSNSKQKTKDGFDLLLDVNQREMEFGKEKNKQQDPVAGLAIQPVFFSPDTTTKIEPAFAKPDNRVRDAVNTDQDSVAERRDLARDARPSAGQRPREENMARDRNVSDGAAEVDRPEPAQTTKNIDGEAVQTDTNADSVAATNNAATASTDDESAVQPSGLVRVMQLIRDFQQQLADLLGQGNPSAIFELVRNFHTQLQAILQGGNPAILQPQLSPTAAPSSTAALPPVAISSAISSDSATTIPEINQTIPVLSQPAVTIPEINQTIPVLSQPAVTVVPAEIASGSPVLTQTAGTILPTQTLPMATSDISAEALVSKTMDDIRQLPNLPSETDQAIADDLLQRLDSIKSLIQVAQANNDTLLTKSPTLSAYVAPVISGNESQPSFSPANPLNLQTATSAVVAATSSNASLADQGDSQGDSRQQSAPSLPASSAGATSSDASARINGASFSRLLNQEPARPVLDQVAFQIKTALKDGSSQITIQLDPVELGKLDIKLQVASDGRTQVVVTADNKDTLTMLQKDSAGLERALSDAGLKADSGSLSFNLRQGQQERDPEYAQASGSYNKTMPEEEIPPASVIARSYVVNLSEGLDIKI